MQLYFDKISGTFTLKCEDGQPEFLGPWDYANAVLMSKYKLTESESREAMLNAFFGSGLAVSIEETKKTARLINRVA
jgi:hypothetical protein